jgi:hypothetical protein
MQQRGTTELAYGVVPPAFRLPAATHVGEVHSR